MQPGIAAFSLAAALTGAVIAAPAAPEAAQAILFLQPEYLRISEILGREVDGADGARLGAIRELLVDRKTHRIQFLTLEGISYQGVSYPVHALRSGEGLRLVLQPDDSASAGASAAGPELLRVSELIGRTLVDGAGALVGPIRDVAVNIVDGTFAYALVEAAGGEWLQVPAAEVVEHRLR